MAACSGTIDTPTEENPPRTGERTQDPAPTPRTGSTTTPRAPAAPADDEDDDDPTPSPPVAAVDPVETPADDEDPPAAPAGDISFASDIWPIFNGKCGPCHVTNGIISNFGDPDVDQAFENSADFEVRVLAAIDTGRMPQSCAGGAPGSPGCLTVDEADAVAAWYEAGAPE